MERSKLAATKEDSKKTKTLLNTTDVIESEKASEQAQKGVLQADECDVFLLLYSRKFLRSVRMRFCQNQSSEMFQSIVLLLEKGVENNTTTIYASSQLSFSVCTVIVNWKKGRLSCLLPIYITWKKLMQPNFKAFAWTIFQPLKSLPKQIFSRRW